MWIQAERALAVKLVPMAHFVSKTKGQASFPNWCIFFMVTPLLESKSIGRFDRDFLAM